MKRHDNLRPLSREHHRALALARSLQRAGELDDDAREELAARAVEAFHAELEPHFALEERELLALSVCGSAELSAHADRIVEEHDRLRERFREIESRRIAEQGPPLGALLTAHVRFEEREWFAALETAGANEFAALAWRLQRKPDSLIESFERDEDQCWVARLDCGHAQHIRHAPPFFHAPWVESETGRQSRIGERLRCPLCRMPRAPACLEVYKETPVFDERTLPAGLRRTHSTRSGTWARIRVLAGQVRYVIENADKLAFELRPGVDGIVAPTRPHRVEMQPGARMQVLFCRPRQDPGTRS